MADAKSAGTSLRCHATCLTWRLASHNLRSKLINSNAVKTRVKCMEEIMWSSVDVFEKTKFDEA
jgi:hypothetical protein